MSNVISIEEYKKSLNEQPEWMHLLDDGISLGEICFRQEWCMFIKASTSESTIFCAWVRFCDVDTDTSWLALFESEDEWEGPYFCEYVLIEEPIDRLQPYQLNSILDQHGQWIDYARPCFPEGTLFETCHVTAGGVR